MRRLVVHIHLGEVAVFVAVVLALSSVEGAGRSEVFIHSANWLLVKLLPRNSLASRRDFARRRIVGGRSRSQVEATIGQKLLSLVNVNLVFHMALIVNAKIMHREPRLLHGHTI